MTRVAAKITGQKRLQKQLRALPDLARAGLLAALKKSVIGIHADVVLSIRKKSSGDKETRYNPKRNVTVSKPGEPPNTDTGKTISGYEFEVDEADLRGAVGSNDKVAAHLEFGTVHMAARPALRPAVKRARRSIPKAFKVEVDSSLRKVRGK